MPGATIVLTLNGARHEVARGTSLLQACRQAGIEVPTLCHDDRLAPIGGCRLCVVEVKGWNRLATSCNTEAADGMEIETHSTSVEETRRTLLELLAHHYPADAVKRSPDKEFHRWLTHYRKLPHSPPAPAPAPPLSLDFFVDRTHPHLCIDMNRCITCFRCARICHEVQGRDVWQVWNRGEATRILPDGRTLLESPCVSCGACADTCPTGAIEDQSVATEGAATRWTRTTCPYCGVGCEMFVGTLKGKIVQIKPALDAPVNKGHLCVKGRYAFGYNHASDRVTEPMIRRGERWEIASWTEAIALIAARFQDLRARFGSDTLAVLGSARATNEDNYVAQKFARIVLGTNNVDCCARVCHAPTAAALKQSLGTGAATNCFDDIEHARAFLLCGTNATENHPIVGARIQQAVRRGARLIVIDPRQIELAREADVHLALRPGTNVPLLNAIACALLDEDLCPQSMLSPRVSGLAELRAFLQDYTPEKVAGLCGVDAGAIRRAARIYAENSPAMCFHGLGVTEHVQGTEGVLCLANLALLTGNYGKPGSGLNPLRGQNNVQGSAHMGCEPANLTGYVSLAEGRGLFERVWRAAVPTGAGLNLMQMLDAAARGELHALWSIGYDVAQTNPRQEETIRALQSIDFVVVQDLFFTEMARACATVFLPVASSYEKDGTFMNSERRVQRVRRALPPPGNAKPDWEIICAIARAMGCGPAFAFDSPEDIWEEIRRVWPAGKGITYARLDHGGLAWPCRTEDDPGTAILHTDSFAHGMPAPLERVPFLPGREAVTEEFPFLLSTGRTLYQFNAGTMTRRTANLELRPTDTLDVAPADARTLGIEEGDAVRVRSRHGESILPARVDAGVRPGELFATFHTPESHLNRLLGDDRDRFTQTPDFKVTAVRVEKVGQS